MFNQNDWENISILVGTVIGAGLFGIPYAVQQAGIIPGTTIVILLGIIMLFINLMMAEITLRTSEIHQLTGYAKKYLGKWAKETAAFAMIVGIYGALTAYTIGVAKSLTQIFGISNILWGAIFLIFVAIPIYLGVKAIGESELIILPLYMLVLVAIITIAISSDYFSLQKLQLLPTLQPQKLLIPYGVILFAYIGIVSIPEIRENTKQVNLPKFWKTILTGSIIPIIAYLIFAVIVTATTGQNTTEIATIGLGNTIGSYTIPLMNSLAILTMGTSFLTLGLALKEMYVYDYQLSKNQAWTLTITIPILLIGLGLHSFITAIEISGAIAGSIYVILTILMFMKAKEKGDRKPEFSIKIPKPICYTFIILFIIGLLHVLI